jgi:hypothetical protein
MKLFNMPTPHGSSLAFGDHVAAWSAMLDRMSVAELGELDALIVAARARRAGEPIEIYSRCVQHASPPAGGYCLHVRWAISDQSYVDWYPTLEAATAAIEALAKREGRVVDKREGYWPSVDLTCPGCHPSRAWISTEGP